MRKIHILFLTSLMVLFTGLVFTPSDARANPKYASIVMDAETGLILHQNNPDKKLHPASLTKMMTLLLTFEALQRGDIRWRDRVVISPYAAAQVPSKLGLKSGSSIRVKDAVYALVTKSANDVAVALAEKLAGSERNFARKMSQRARQIGMHNTVFRNASGLHDKRQISTARDMAKLSRHLIYAHPKYYELFSMQSFTYAGQTYRNHNRLLKSYDGMDGLKTGYVHASGFNLAASAVRGDRRLIAVVFGGKSSKRRNAHMKVLLDRGFSKIDDMQIAQFSIGGDVPVPDQKPDMRGTQLAQMQYGLQGLKSIIPAALTMQGNTYGFKGAIGQGDFEEEAFERLKTGVIAIQAHTQTGDTLARDLNAISTSSAYQPETRMTHNTSTTHYASTQSYLKDAKGWAIQVGAFASRDKADQLVRQSWSILPDILRYSARIVVPVRTQKGLLFRGRLVNFSQKDAEQACALIRQSCVVIPPRG